MRGLNVATVTGGAGAAIGRNIRLQVRYSRMTEVAITTMGDINRRIFGTPRIVTIVTWACEGHITGSDMVDTAVRRRITRMAIQAVGRVGTQGDGVNDLLSRAVMTGFTGTGPVGGNIVFSAINLRPVRHSMTAATGRPARQISNS
jgi:hypothetical protein